MRVATAVGGTFTDLVYFEVDQKTGKAGNIKIAKSDTTPPSYEIGVFNTILPPNIVAIQLKILIPVGTAIIIVALVK